MVVRYLIFSLFSLVFCFNLAYGKTIYGKAKVIDGDTIHIGNNKLGYMLLMLQKQNKDAEKTVKMELWIRVC